MTDWEHEQLCACLRNLRGKVVLSGYENGLYRNALGDWTTRSHSTVGGSNRGSVRRTEVVWMNRACAA